MEARRSGVQAAAVAKTHCPAPRQLKSQGLIWSVFLGWEMSATLRIVIVRRAGGGTGG